MNMTQQITSDRQYNLISRSGGFSNAEGFDVREAFKLFFNNEGAVSWQHNTV